MSFRVWIDSAQTAREDAQATRETAKNVRRLKASFPMARRLPTLTTPESNDMPAILPEPTIRRKFTTVKIEIVTKNVDDDSMVREYMQRKIHFALDRIGARIDKVVARLHDDSPGSGVFAGRCSIEVELHPKGHIHVSAAGESAFDCVLQAVQKMAHAVRHEIDRKRNSANIRHQQARRSTGGAFSDLDESLSTDS